MLLLKTDPRDNRTYFCELVFSERNLEFEKRTIDIFGLQTYVDEYSIPFEKYDKG